MFKNIIKKYQRAVTFIFPIILTGILFYIRQTDYPTYEPWGLEDGVMENIEAILFMFTSIMFGYIAWKLGSKKYKFERFVFVMFGLAVFIVAMEEISWGQRILSTETGGIFAEHNVQNENNIHNLSIFYDLIRYVYISVGLFGTLGWILKRISFKNLTIKRLQFFIPDWYTATYFVMLLLNLTNTIYAAPQDLEYTELLLSMGTAVYAIYMLQYFNNANLLKHNNADRRPQSST